MIAYDLLLYYCYCNHSERKRARRHLGSPACKKCSNIFPAFHTFFGQEEEKQVSYFILKLC